MKDANYLQLSHLVSEFMQGSKGKVMHLLFPSLLTPSLFSQMRISKQKRPPSVNHLLKESLFYSVHHRSLSHTLTLFHPVFHDLILYCTLSWIFFFCAFLLTRPLLWKRLGAVGISSIWYACSHLISRQFDRLQFLWFQEFLLGALLPPLALDELLQHHVQSHLPHCLSAGYRALHQVFHPST
jgi:hypothetical protein